MDSDSDSEPPKKSRRSFTLRVAMKFPAKNGSPKKSPSPEPAPKSKEPEVDFEEDDFIAKRALNIKENKAMVRKCVKMPLRPVMSSRQSKKIKFNSLRPF